MDRKKRHIQVKHGWKKKTHPSEWNMDKKKQVNVKETFALPGCFRSVGKHLDAGQRREDDRIVAQRGRASELCVLFCVEELCDHSTYIALGKTKRDDRSGEKQTKSQCGGQAPRQGQNGGSIFFSPPLLLAPSSPFFFLQRNKKLNLVSFFVQALFLGFEGVFCFYFSLIDLLIISWT